MQRGFEDSGLLQSSPGSGEELSRYQDRATMAGCAVLGFTGLDVTSIVALLSPNTSKPTAAVLTAVYTIGDIASFVTYARARRAASNISESERHEPDPA
jgi:hypothetical protein